jgi:hypothetical protein
LHCCREVGIPTVLISHWPELANRPGRISACLLSFQLSNIPTIPRPGRDCPPYLVSFLTSLLPYVLTSFFLYNRCASIRGER